MNDTQNLKRCVIGPEYDNMRFIGVQPHGRIDLKALSGKLGLFGQQGKHTVQPHQIVFGLLDRPLIDRVIPNAIAIHIGLSQKDDLPRHLALRSAIYLAMS